MARPPGPGGVGTKGMEELMENPPRLRPNTNSYSDLKLILLLVDVISFYLRDRIPLCLSLFKNTRHARKQAAFRC
jgi:hypothetical protein